MLVAGAGPSGMTAALTLAAFGVRSTVLEAHPSVSATGSKAICVQRDVLSTLGRLGIGEPLAKRGVSWTVGRTYFGDDEVFQTRFPEVGENSYPPFVNVSQAETEQALLERIDAEPLVEVRFEHRVTGLEQDADGVTVALDTPDGELRIQGPYLVAADGGRSRVRELLGVEFPGHSHSDRFIIADIRAKLPFPNERRFFFDPPFNPGRQVLVHPQPDDVWRIDWQVPGDVDAEQERQTGRLEDRIRKVIGDVDYELVWLSTYTFHQRVADRFRVGRVFLAGDAAHLMAPFGARGMNSGIIDGENVAWKLALVLRDEAPDELLATYETERQGAAIENVRVTDKTMQFMVPRNRVRQTLRSALLRASVHAPAVRRFVNSGRLAEPYEYRSSPIVVPDPHVEDRPRRSPAATLVRAAVDNTRALGAWLEQQYDGRTVTAPVAARPGSLAPDGPCEVEGRPGTTRLRDLFAGTFTILWIGADPLPVPDDGLDLPPLQHLLLHGGFAHGREQALAVRDTTGALHRAYDGAAFYLVRPDGYVAARRTDPPTPEAMVTLLRWAAGRPPSGQDGRGARDAPGSAA